MSIRGRHLPALDGLRAVAILGVFAYHLGFGWASGGFLGVDLFFVLSGFLITSLLVEERLETGAIALSGFWLRRARRLLPGLVLMMLVLGAFIALFGPGPLVDLAQVRSDAIATLLYFANWHQLLAHQSYFSQFAAPSPLQQTWSLGIEEQFYLLWPLAVVALLVVARQRWRTTAVAVTAGGAALSAAWMAWLAFHGASASRMYYGTDTRAFDLLVGAVLAFIIAGRSQPGPRARRALATIAPMAAVVLGLFWWRAGSASGEPSRSLFEWGFLVCACLAVLVLADVRQEVQSPLGRALSVRPVVFVGQISYELYLWHWPVICEVTQARTGLSGLVLDTARVAIAFVLATLSFFFVDRPIRRYAFRGWPPLLRASVVPAGMVSAAAVMVVATLPGPAVAAPVPQLVQTSGPQVPGAGHTAGGPIRLATKPSRAHPLRVILFGDSVMRDEAAAIMPALQSTHVVRVTNWGFDGWGLTTDTGWRQNVPSAIELNHAQLVIVMWSFDDTFLVKHPREYRRWLSEFVRLVLSQRGVRGLVFEQFPPIGPGMVANPVVAARDAVEANGPVSAWNAMARSMVSISPRKVMYLPLASSLEWRGHFEFWLPPGNRWSLPAAKWVRVRSADAVHLCPPGAARYAAALVADLTPLFHLPATSANWSSGSWTKTPQFESPPGACPNDHPSSRP
ncbi:MAG: acyltransferase family protein [Acidimicrobiales bacterium]